MKQYVGVSQDQTSICVVDESGRVLWQGKCASTPEAIAATLRSKAPQAERMESGPPLSIWLCHGLRALGLPGCPPRQGGVVAPAQQERR
jgi:transposase